MDMDHQSLRFLRLVPLACLSLLAVMGVASASDTRLEGRIGIEAVPFRADCPDGFYLVGINGRTGSWVDAIQTVCAPWHVQEGVFGKKIYGVHFGGQGGAGTSAVCPFHTGIDSFGVEVMHEGKRYVEEINVSCRQTSGRKLHLTMVPFGGANDNPYGGTARLACQPGELATGIHGRASEYIEAIGLICGPEPFVLEGPTTTTPESSAPPLDKERASILKQPGDSVAKHVGKPKVDVVSNQPGAGVADAVKKPNIDVLSNPGATSRGSFSGVWATVTSGGGRYTMTLAQEGGSVDGSYASPDGRITGTISGQISGGVLNYRWSEGSSTGSGKFTLAADGNSFEGWWSSDASPDARNGWNGSRK